MKKRIGAAFGLSGIAFGFLTIGFSVSGMGAAWAQDQNAAHVAGANTVQAAEHKDAWIQIEALPTPAAAEEALMIRAETLDNVAGFRLPGGWYAVALGPFGEDEVLTRMAELKASSAIPPDSFVTHTAQYRSQFWPEGADAVAAAAAEAAQPAEVLAEAVTPEIPVTPEAAEQAAPEQAEPEATEPEAAPEAPEAAPETARPAEPETAEPAEPVGETLAEARASERALTRDQRKALQIALQWQGFYKSGIDGAFGPGTRKAMRLWQEARSLEPTGVLTTAQRARLLAEYQAEIGSLGLGMNRDEEAGIEMILPLGLVAFDRYEAPFAHYRSVDDSGVEVVLISQAGDQNTLFGLYDIMQSLKIVPLDGERSRKAREFTISGSDDQITSYTYARLVDGAVKGFTLIWPVDGNERLRDLALREMRASFTPIPGQVLADDAGLDQATQSINLMSGLEIRRPELSRSGFFVSPDGAVVTTADAVAQCRRITIDEIHEADVARADPGQGLALLTPREALAPMRVAELLETQPRLTSKVAVAGYPFEGALSAPTLTFGLLADMRGLRGEEDVVRLDLVAEPGDAGGPVLAPGGQVLGMLAPRPEAAGQRLPDDVNYAVKSGVLAGFLTEAGITPAQAGAGPALDPVDLTELATQMTVLVSCWR